MNESNGITKQTTLNEKEQKFQHHNHHNSSALPTFLKWFKKDSKYSNNTHETINSTRSAGFDQISSSSSCDSTISTSTTGFIYIKPSNYKPERKINARKLFFETGFEIDEIKTNKNRMNNYPENNNLSLRTKYHLYNVDTLKSNNDNFLNKSNNDNSNCKCFDLSLPNVKNNKLTNELTNSSTKIQRRHRRTVSDSSKEKRSGAYVHVKGKRKAPQPPNYNLRNRNSLQIFDTTNSNQSINNYTKGVEKISPLSTLNKKKRRAPPPPPLNLQSTHNKSYLDVDDNFNLKTSNNFFSSKDKNTIFNNNTDTTTHSYENLNNKNHHQINTTTILKDIENFFGTSYVDKLSDMQKQTILEKVVEVQTPTKTNEITMNSDTKICQSSPISPRPWYKRPISYNRDSSIPFKREVVLKTMEKRKQKQKEKDTNTSNSYPQVNYSRSSIFDTGHKFGFFMRHKDNSNDAKSKDKEKRRSGIGMPNISELDREAAAIVSEEQKSKNKNKQNSTPSDHVILQQQMFLSNNIDDSKDKIQNDHEDISSNAKDLISKFDFDLDKTKITLNTSFIGRSDLFTDNKINSESSSSPLSTSTSTSSHNILENNDENKNDKEQQKLQTIKIEKEDIKDEDNSMPKLSWNCPVCTLENPSWRIMCEVCERLKPFEKFSKIENKNILTKSTEKLKNSTTDIIINDGKPKTNNCEWEKKTEKVMKYFKPLQNENNNVLSKSPSESNVAKKQLNKKSPSPSKLPIGSPKLNVRNRSRISEEIAKDKDQIKKINSEKIENSTEKSDEKNIDLDNEIKQPLLDSSVIVTTVTPVFYATKTSKQNSDTKNENCPTIDLKEVRNARLLKFTPKENNSNCPGSNEDLLKDPNYLEMEKQRLRDKIRAMNAKALTEKYPILQKAVSLDDNNINQIELGAQQANETSQGAVKKILPHNRQSFDISENCNKIKSAQTNYDSALDALKPKKVSASAQTSTVVKKDTEIESEKVQSENIMAKTLENFSKETNLGKIRDQIVNNIEVIESKEQKPLRKLISNDKNDKLISSSAKRFQKKEIGRTDTITLNKIMRNLESAISEGNDELAARIAMDLAKMKVSLQVTKIKNQNKIIDNQNNQQHITANIIIEDKTSQKRSVQLDLQPNMIIMELKQKIYHDYNIPMEEQKWLINEQIVDDDFKTLQQYNVTNDSSKFYLTSISVNNVASKENKLSKLIPKKALFEDILGDLSDDDDDDQTLDVTAETNDIHGATALPPKSVITVRTWECPLCTLINPIENETCTACSKAKPLKFRKKNNQIEKDLFAKQNDDPLILSNFVFKRQPENGNDLNKSNSNRKSADILNIIDETITKVLQTQIEVRNAFHISSPNITKYKYRGVDNFNPNRKSLDQINSQLVPKEIKIKGTEYHRSKINPPNLVVEERKQQQQQLTNTKTHYLELLDLENSDIVLNTDVFECPICFMKSQPGEGIMLRDCLHTFCKECLINTVQFSDEAEVKCPYMDTEYSCTSVIQDREIKSIVPKDIYELHLAKSVRVAEHQIENTFHCKTPNCRGWCIYEDNVNQFKCPVCKITNCLTCRVIHDGLSCKQYQDRLNSDCDSNLEARRTKEMLKEMVEKGEAMNCPTCQVVLMKKWGCDWLKCSMCKTEICWVTRGARWGPGGKGDTTGGCKCGVDGKKCHPKCNYCH